MSPVNSEVLESMGDETLKKLTSDLTEKLRNSTTVDWQVRDSVRAKMRLLIKRLLRKYKYPPEGQEAAVRRGIEQAEGCVRNGWSRFVAFNDSIEWCLGSEVTMAALFSAGTVCRRVR